MAEAMWKIVKAYATMKSTLYMLDVLKKSRGNQGATSNEQRLVVGVRQIHEEVIY